MPPSRGGRFIANVSIPDAPRLTGPTHGRPNGCGCHRLTTRLWVVDATDFSRWFAGECASLFVLFLSRNGRIPRGSWYPAATIPDRASSRVKPSTGGYLGVRGIMPRPSPITHPRTPSPRRADTSEYEVLGRDRPRSRILARQALDGQIPRSTRYWAEEGSRIARGRGGGGRGRHEEVMRLRCVPCRRRPERATRVRGGAAGLRRFREGPSSDGPAQARGPRGKPPPVFPSSSHGPAKRASKTRADVLRRSTPAP